MFIFFPLVASTQTNHIDVNLLKLVATTAFNEGHVPLKEIKDKKINYGNQIWILESFCVAFKVNEANVVIVVVAIVVVAISLVVVSKYLQQVEESVAKQQVVLIKLHLYN